MKKIGVLLFFAILGFGCLSSPVKDYHQIDLSISAGDIAGPIQKSIYIDRISTQSFYDNFEIVYRESPYTVKYYTYHFWAEKPGPLIRNAIYNVLKKNNVFSNILLELAVGNPDLTLKARIRAIEEDDRVEAWYARLSMELEVLDFKTNERLVYHEFDRLEKMPEMNIEKLPEVLSRILGEELQAVIQALSKDPF